MELSEIQSITNHPKAKIEKSDEKQSTVNTKCFTEKLLLSNKPINTINLR